LLIEQKYIKFSQFDSPLEGVFCFSEINRRILLYNRNGSPNKINMNQLQLQLKNIAQETTGRLGFIFIDTVFRGNDRNIIFQILIDGEKGLSADDCATVSRAVDEIIEKENLISSKYVIEVSSPGADRPLQDIRQYPKHINRKFEIKYTDNNETKNLKAKLVKVEGDSLTFDTGKDEITVDFNKIDKAQVIISL
jgi:ribosome maturation factor RimP